MLTRVCLLGRRDRVVYAIDGRSTQTHVAEQMEVLLSNSTCRSEVEKVVGEGLECPALRATTNCFLVFRLLLTDFLLTDTCRRLPQECRAQLEPAGCL